MKIDTARKDKALTLLCSFFLPALLMLLAFAVVGVYPFGDKSLLIVDMHNEYIDYLAQMNESVHQSGSFLRTWNMGMGLNMLGLIAFYTASPFNLIVLLLPLRWITEAVLAVTLLKIGLCGLLFAVYARTVFPTVPRVFHVLFAVGYALSAYNIAYSSNIMWLDGSAFLPLVLLGAEKILREKKCGLFLFSLVYVFFTSYYIGYMIGVFSFLYFTAVYFLGQNSWREYFERLRIFLVSAVLAAGCCAFLLFPAFLNLRSGQNDMWNIPFEAALRLPFTRIASKLLPGAYDSLTDAGMPNIYCTVLAVFLLILYFFTKPIPIREKLVFGGLLSFLLLSFSCGILDLAWHAFEDPTWFPARYSFVFSFLVLYLSLRCVCSMEKTGRREIFIATGILVLLFVEIGVNRYRFMGMRPVIAGLSLAVLYGLAFAFKGRRALPALLVFLVCMESWGNASAMMVGMDGQFQYKSRSAYREFMDLYARAFEKLRDMDDGVYRVEIVEQRGANGGMALGYNGISHYSSTTDQALNSFLRRLGYNVGTINELRFAPSTPITNGILGIKYVLSPIDLGGGYSAVEEDGQLVFYENNAAFPLAHWAPQEALDFEADGEGPFELQNGLLRALTGDAGLTAFTPLAVRGEKLTNVEKTVHDDYIEYTRQIRNREAYLEFEIENPLMDEAYAFFPVYDGGFSVSEVYVNDVFVQKDLTYRANSIIPLGDGDAITLRIVLGGDMVRVENGYFAALDISASRLAAAEAQKHQMDFTSFLDTRVDGSVTVPKSGILATSFPYDDGWRVDVDGRRVQPQRLAGVFMAIPLEAGTHEVSMRYNPPGLLAGCGISLIFVSGIILWYLKRRGLTFLFTKKEK